jgi:hypothetical protein
VSKTAGVINVNFDTVAASIAGLTMTGIKVMGLNSVPDNALMLCPIFYPLPNGFITGLRPVIETFGSFGSEQMTLNYDLTFRYLHSQIAGGLPGLFVYSSMITNIKAIAKVILTNDTLAGAENVRLKTITNIGPVADPAGNKFHGCDFIISVEEYT